MPRARGVSVLIATYMFVLMTAAGSTRAAAQTSTDRIAQKIQSDEVEAVPGTSHPLALPEYDQGRVSGSMALHHVSIVFRLSPAQQEDLDQLAAEQQDPSSANYHKWLTPDQYADRFGLTRNDAAKVVSWLKSQGLTVESVSRGRTEIFFSGSAAQIEAALHTELHQYVVNGVNHFANASEPSVPSAFSGMVLGFRNLDDFRPKPRAIRRKASAAELAAHYTSGQGDHFLAPDDFAVIYDLQPLYNASLDGTGVTIGVVGDSAVSLTDIEAFRSAANLPTNNPQIVNVPGDGTPTVNSDEGEADLDLEWSGAVARNASIIYYVAGCAGCAFDALDYAINPAIPTTLAQVISNSFGLCEAQETSSGARAVEQLVQQANSQGQTVTSASGDTGAADCDASSATVAVDGLAVDVPASVPEVTAVGGSEFNGDVSNPSLYWGAVNGPGGGTALRYIPEVAWNDIIPLNSNNTGKQIAAGGGGASLGSASGFFAKPSWQNGTGVPADGARDVPDVALNASPFHDGYLLCTSGSCTDGFSNGEFIQIVGGTSAGAPTMAGILAIINQATKSCGLSNANPELYSLWRAPASTAAFHDIAPQPMSSNMVPCTPGTPSTDPTALRCPSSGKFGYNTTAGYDQATGLGSIDAHLLTTNWPGYNPGPTVNTSATVVSSSPSANVGVPVTFTATISSSGNACLAITGSVQFTSDGVNIGGPVTITNGIATVQDSSLTVGTHQIVAKYLGDANYLASTSPAITQTITAVPDYVFSQLTPPNLTLSPGASGQSTITVKANSIGFTGTINFTCAPSSLTAQIGCSFNPTSIALSNTITSGQTIMTVTTMAPTPASASLGRSTRFSWMAASTGAFFAGLMLMGIAPRRRWPALACLVVVTFLSAGIGCGGSSNNSNPGNPGTPAGSYTIQVTATSTTGSGAGPTHTTMVSLTVP